MPHFSSYTSYTEPEDLKRLNFIVTQVQKEIGSTGKILDVGCGNGNISLALASLGYQVKGIDISEESVQKARGRSTFENLSFEAQNAEELTATEERFDAIVCSEVLEHLNQPEGLASVLSVLLKPTGVLIVTVPNGYGPRELLVTQPIIWMEKNGFGKVIAKVKKALGYANATVQSSNPDLTHVQFFTQRSLKRILQLQNLENTRWEKANFIEKVFPFSFVANRITILKKWDCKLADYLPVWCSSGFYTAWKKK